MYQKLGSDASCLGALFWEGLAGYPSKLRARSLNFMLLGATALTCTWAQDRSDEDDYVDVRAHAQKTTGLNQGGCLSSMHSKLIAIKLV